MCPHENRFEIRNENDGIVVHCCRDCGAVLMRVARLTDVEYVSKIAKEAMGGYYGSHGRLLWPD